MRSSCIRPGDNDSLAAAGGDRRIDFPYRHIRGLDDLVVHVAAAFRPGLVLDLHSGYPEGFQALDGPTDVCDVAITRVAIDVYRQAGQLAVRPAHVLHFPL